MSTLITKIINCPFCRVRVNVYARQCSSCNVDLSLLSDLNLLPYALYNQGLERLREDDLCGAIIKLSAAVELGVDFKEAHLLLAKIAESIGLQVFANRQRELANNE
jgi:hypothetical protein